MRKRSVVFARERKNSGGKKMQKFIELEDFETRESATTS